LPIRRSGDASAPAANENPIFLPLLQATIDGNSDSRRERGIENYSIEWDKRAAVTVVLASAGYPGKYETGKAISGLNEGRET